MLILLSLATAVVGAVVAFAAARREASRGALAWARRLAYAFAGLMAAANLLMVYALVTHDFTVSYVAQVGSRSRSHLGRGGEPLVVARGLDPVLGPRARRLHGAAATWAIGDRHPEYMPHAVGVWLACAAFFASCWPAPRSRS